MVGQGMAKFEANIIEIYANQGRLWLEELPALEKALCDLWGLSQVTPLQNLSYNYVAAAHRGSDSVVLKIGLDPIALKREFDSLRAFDGHGCIRVLAFDSTHNALLLEKVDPGISLRGYFMAQEAEAMRILSEVIRKLQEVPPPPAGFPHVADWLSILDNQWPFPGDYLAKARQVRDRLLATSPASVLLHGDLHHDNILSNGVGSWIAIDPHGVMGDPAYEVGAFIRNPIPELQDHPDCGIIINNRVTILSEALGIPVQRIQEWCYVQTILGACWSVQDNQSPDVLLRTIPFYDSFS